jgi:N-acyl-D-amino-acid deacylase
MDSHGAWIASAIDLARFAVSFDDNGAGTLLQPATLQTMFSRPAGRAALDDNGKPKDRCYAAGWAREETSAGPYLSHGGALAGTATYLVKRPDGRNWIILFNTRQSLRSTYLPRTLEPKLNKLLDAVATWPTHDLFPRYPDNQPLPKVADPQP